MSFLNRKRFKFNVDLQVTQLSDVPLVNAVLFAKVRLLQGGSFVQSTERVEVANHVACWRRRFLFSCRIGSDVNSGILASCLCRISVRKELKGGKAYQKLGFVDINLAEFAASGVEGLTRSYLLDGYDSGHQRQDNSRITVKVTMVHQSADPFFKVPREHWSSDQQQIYLNPADRKAPSHETTASSTTIVMHSTIDDNQSSTNSTSSAADVIDNDSTTTTPAAATSFTIIENGRTPAVDNQRIHSWLLQNNNLNGLSTTPTLSMRTTTATNIDKQQQRWSAISDRSTSKNYTSGGGTNHRVEKTRVDAEQFIDSMLKETIGEYEHHHQHRSSNDDDDDPDCSSEGLALYISKDGQAAVVGANSLVQTDDAFVRVQIADTHHAGQH